MPFIRVETNIKIDSDRADELVADLSKFVASVLDKPEIYVTAMLHQDVTMVLSGKNDPAAFVTFGSIMLQSDKCAELSNKLCEFIFKELAIQGARVFIEFRDLERSMFGWDGRTF